MALGDLEPTPLERVEGGIISTWVALRCLCSNEQDDARFRSRGYARHALRYLLDRQCQTGAFGRPVSSRSGIEVLGSTRHTAYAVSALLALAGPPQRIFESVLKPRMLSEMR